MDVDEEYMRKAVQLYEKEGMSAVRKQYPKCQHTMTIARYRRALAGTSGQRAHYRFLKSKIKAYLIEKKKHGHKVTRDLAKKGYEEIKDSCINGNRLKVCPRLLNKLVKEVLNETSNQDGNEVEYEEVEWVDVNDYLEDDVQIAQIVGHEESNFQSNLNLVDTANLGTDFVIDTSSAEILNNSDQQFQVVSVEGHQPLLVDGQLPEDVIAISNPDHSITAVALKTAQPSQSSCPPLNSQSSVSIPCFPSFMFRGQDPQLKRLKWSKVVLIGDSLIQLSFKDGSDWGLRLTSKLTRVADVINRGFVGYNTSWYKSMIKSILNEWSPNQVSCLILSFGMIDSCNVHCPTRQHVPYNEFKSNLIEIISIINNHGIPSSRLILIGPPYFDKLQFKLHRKSMEMASKLVRKGSEVLIYNKGVNQISKAQGIEFIDLYNLIKDHKNDGQCPLVDGLHLSKNGSDLLFEKLEPIVMKKIELFNNSISNSTSNCGGNLAMVGEPWQDIAKRQPKPLKKRFVNADKSSLLINNEEDDEEN